MALIKIASQHRHSHQRDMIIEIKRTWNFLSFGLTVLENVCKSERSRWLIRCSKYSSVRKMGCGTSSASTENNCKFPFILRKLFFRFKLEIGKSRARN